MPKIPKDIKNRMERELRQYWNNIKKLERLEKEIIEEENGSEDGQFKSNTTSDPTCQKVLKLLSTRSLIVLNERILYVTNTINRLKPFEKEVFYMIFKNNYDCTYCESMKRYF